MRPYPQQEFVWNPIFQEIRPDDTVRRAALRGMQQSWAAPLPSRWIDLNLCNHFLVGDYDVVDWCVGYGVESPWEPPIVEESGCAAAAVKTCWQPVSRAFQLLEADDTRRALLRLHLEAG